MQCFDMTDIVRASPMFECVYQVEQFAGSVILTGQEAPDSVRRIREDLLKRWITGEGIAGRKPYGLQTRMMRPVHAW